MIGLPALDLQDANWEALSRLLIAALAPASIYKIEHPQFDFAGEKRIVNLIILLPNTETRPVREYEPIIQLTSIATASVQCSFHRVHTVAEWITKGHPFFCRHFIPENLIYDDGSVSMPVPQAAVIESMNKRIAEQFRIFFGKAEAFYKCALLLRDQHQDTPPALVTFMLHQAVELGYRSILESLNGHCRKTHELRQLRPQTFRCAPALGNVFPDDTAAERKLVDILESAYSGARYNNQFSITSNLLTALFERTYEFLTTAQAIGPCLTS